MTIEFDPRHAIDRMFQQLASRLEPIIASTLAPHLGGLSWTAILEERDRLRGKSPAIYAVSDPQAQLKVLTERLGSIGFPFDDHTRTVSVLGGELRIARNRWAHHGELTALDAWRTGDFVVRLLERFEDHEGVEAASDLRDEAFSAVVREKGIAEHAIPVRDANLEAPVADESFAIPRVAADLVSIASPSPAPRLGVDGLAAAQTASESAVARAGVPADTYEPWPVVAVGGSDVIDGLPKKAMKEQVRAVASEIVDYEGPVHLKRLAQLTAASFGVARLSEKREKKIIYQIRQTEGIFIDTDKFAWSSEVEPATWTQYRQNSAMLSRDFLMISPVEIANAMRALGVVDTYAEDEDLYRAVLPVFGKSRLTTAFRRHLERAQSLI